MDRNLTTVYFGSDDNHTYAVSVSTGREVWRRRTGGRVRASPVLNRDQDMLYFGSWDGHFYCVQSNDSTPVWNYSTSLCPVGPKHADWVPHSCPIASNPAMDANSTFVLFGADDYKLHALDPATGAFLWVYPTLGFVRAAPTLAFGDNLALVGSFDGRLHAVFTRRGWHDVLHVMREGEAEWATGLGPVTAGGVAFNGVSSKAAVHEATLSVFCGSWDWHVYALDVLTGVQRWRFKTEGPVESGPVVVGSGNGTTADPLLVVAGSSDGNVYALSAQHGQEVWRFKTGNAVRAGLRLSPDGETLFAGSWDDCLYALDPRTGRYLWRFVAGDDIVAAPAIGQREEGMRAKIIVGSDDHYVYAVTPTPPSQVLLIAMCSLAGFCVLVGLLCWRQRRKRERKIAATKWPSYSNPNPHPYVH